MRDVEIGRRVCLSVCPAAFPPPTTGSSGCECNLIADVAWLVPIGLQLQEPTNTARPSLEKTYAGHRPAGHVSPAFPPALILMLQTTVGGECWHDIALIPADARPHDIAAAQFAGQQMTAIRNFSDRLQSSGLLYEYNRSRS